MLQQFLSWLDNRTDYRRLLAPIRARMLPGGPRWEYSTGSCLLWILIVQLVTGLLLMATYSPSVTSAWASVHYIEQSGFGSFIRGLHYYSAHALIVFFAIHTIRVLLRAGFRPPGELIWITGLLLIPLVIIWAITGNPLAATVKGMAQIEVEGSIIGSTPLIGPLTQRVLLGGDEVGHLTLTHLYFLHVGLLPLLVGGLLVVHISQVYRHGLSTLRTGRSLGEARPYWPDQTVRNMTVLLIVLSTVAVLAWKFKAPLDAPADSELPHIPRPEWYLLFLFELRRYFSGHWEFVVTVLSPLGILVLLLMMPLIDGKCSARVSMALRLIVVVVGCGGWAALTMASAIRDWQDDEFQASRQQSVELAARARVLADQDHIPPEGAVELLRNDSRTQGPLLFARHCAGCHSSTDSAGHGIRSGQSSAPNLYGFASPDWIAGLLDRDQIASPRYFGNTKLAAGDMASAVTDVFDSADDAQAKAELRTQLQKVARALSAQAALPSQAGLDKRDAPTIAEGTKLLSVELGCTECHRFGDQGELGSAPDLTGYGSKAWLKGMIANPQHERFYPKELNDRMPAFAESQQNSAGNILTARELDLLVDWLRGDDRAVAVAP